MDITRPGGWIGQPHALGALNLGSRMFPGQRDGAQSALGPSSQYVNCIHGIPEGSPGGASPVPGTSMPPGAPRSPARRRPASSDSTSRRRASSRSGGHGARRRPGLRLHAHRAGSALRPRRDPRPERAPGIPLRRQRPRGEGGLPAGRLRRPPPGVRHARSRPAGLPGRARQGPLLRGRPQGEARSGPARHRPLTHPVRLPRRRPLR